MKSTRILASLALVACFACGGAAQTRAASPGIAPAASAAAAAAATPAPAHIGPDGIADPQPHGVRLVLDLATLRDHPVGKRLGPLIVNMPQWRETLKGIVTDPIKEIDWVYLAGPSASDTSKDAIVIHHSLGDAAIEKAIDVLHQRSTSVVPYDTGVPGVKATIGTIDVGPRVLVRAQPNLLAVVPPDFAKVAAKVMVSAVVASPAQNGETLRWWVSAPHQVVSLIPDTVQEATAIVVARADGGADVSVDGKCASDADAQKVADLVSYMVRENNGFVIKMLTRGLLDGVKVTTEGSVVHVKVAASEGQLEAITTLLTRALGGEMKPPAATGTTQL